MTENKHNSEKLNRRDFLKMMSYGSVALGATGVLAACAQQPTPEPPTATEAIAAPMPLKGTKIKVLLESFQYHDYVKSRVAEFTQQTGIEVEIEEVAFKVALQQIETELSSGSDAYDVVQMIFIKTQRWMRPGWIAGLGHLIARDGYDVADFIPALMDAHRWEGKQYSLPYLAELVQMMYRSDKLAELNLSVPQTFDELDQVMAKIHNPPDFYAFVQRMQPAGVHFPFPAWLQGFGGNIFRYPPNDLTPTLNTSEALAATENFLNLVKKYSIGGTQTYDLPDCQAAMSQGKSGFYIDALGQMGPIRLPDQSTVADKVEIALVPAGPVARVPQLQPMGMPFQRRLKSKKLPGSLLKGSELRFHV